MSITWKANWEEVRQHHLDWWQRTGIVIGKYWQPCKVDKPVEVVPDPGRPSSIEQFYTDPSFRAQWSCFDLSQKTVEGDVIPMAWTDIGPGSLATFLGSQPGFDESTVWFDPCIDDPDAHPPLTFDPENFWWKLTVAILEENKKVARGRYFIPCPDLVENLDTLASLRGTQALLSDLLERPDWVKERLAEINRVYFEAYDQIYDIIKTEGDASTFGAFWIWGPGKTIKIQCDISAMLSPDLFAEFALPFLREQCEWANYSMYHLDGSVCLHHLDKILSIDALDAVEFTPDPNVPSGTDPTWHDIYRRILDAGKSVQVVDARKDEVLPFLKTLGSNGFYFCVSDFSHESELMELYNAAH